MLSVINPVPNVPLITKTCTCFFPIQNISVRHPNALVDQIRMAHRATALPAVLAQYQQQQEYYVTTSKADTAEAFITHSFLGAIAPSANDLCAQFQEVSHAYSCITRWLSRVDLGESGQPSKLETSPR